MISLSQRVLVSTVAVTALFAASGAMAQTRQFNVPSEDAAKSIPEFARQAGIQITAPVSDLHGISTPAIIGAQDVRAALAKLIQGIGLEVVSDQNSVVVLRRLPKSNSQSSAADGTAGLEEVVVTAEKRATNVQRTPIAMAVVGGQDIANRSIVSLDDLSDGSIPGLRIAPFGDRNSALTIGMRGVGAASDSNQPARDQGVAVYVDGVYLGRAQGLASALYDVDRIEVLKGPQGTLFGRNSEGGALSILTRQPTGVFGMTTSIGYGDYNSYKAATHIDLPTWHDVSVKIDGVLDKRDGLISNPTTSGQPGFDAYDKKGIAAQVQWKPSDHFSATYGFDNSTDLSTPFLTQTVKVGSFPLAPILTAQPDRPTSAEVGVPLQFSVGRNWGHRLNLDWNIADGLDLKSITSYRALSQSQFDNGGPTFSVYAPNGVFGRYSLENFYQTQYSQEFQLIGHTAEVDYVGGIFYYHEAVRDNAQTPNSEQWNATGTSYSFLPLNLATVPYDRASHVATNSYAAYGQATWTPSVLGGVAHLTVGGRYTQDGKQGDLDVLNGAIPSYVNAAGKTIVGIIPLDHTWDHFDPLVTLAVDVAPSVNIYGKWSTGFKAGGANSRSLTYRPFDPESVSMYEVGAKMEFFDRRVRLNVDGYYGDIKDAQIDFSVVVPFPTNTRATQETTNAATGRTEGVDADLTVKVADGLTATASYTLAKVTLSQAFNPFTNTLSVVYPIYQPQNAASVAVDYERPVPGATLRAHVDANYSDGQYTSSTDPTLSDASTVMNGRLALSDIALDGTSSRLEIALWSRNLFNEAHLFQKNFNSFLGYYGVFNEPRTFGVEAKVKF